MKGVHIWVFYISFLVSFQLLIGQQKDETVSIEVSDSSSASEKTPLSLRFGVDLYRVILSQVSDDFNGIEIVSDLRLGENFLEQILKDYNGQTYWLSANIHSFFKKSNFSALLPILELLSITNCKNKQGGLSKCNC